ncbi:MAG: hypothetical protein EB168_08815, partial [Euryarchaeota archaeon]|nr:hypothetical protein [Euryarchaeota archaeon]
YRGGPQADMVRMVTEVVALIVKRQFHDCEVLVVGLKPIEKSLEVFSAANIIARVKITGYQP